MVHRSRHLNAGKMTQSNVVPSRCSQFCCALKTSRSFSMGALIRTRYHFSVCHCLFLANQHTKSGATWLEAEYLGKPIACNIVQANTAAIHVLGTFNDVSQGHDIIKTMWIGPSERAGVRGANGATFRTPCPAYDVGAAPRRQACCGHALVIHHVPTSVGVLIVGDPPKVARGDS